MITLKGCAAYIRVLLMVCNGVCCMCGFFLFVFGIVGVSSRLALALMLKHCDRDLGDFSDLLNIPEVLQGLAAFMIVVGVLCLCFGGIGFYAVANNDQTMLLGYASMVLTLMLLEVCLIVYAVADQEQKMNYVKMLLYKSLRRTYYTVPNLELVDPLSRRSSPGNQIASSWLITEVRYMCCGANGFYDYQTFKWNNHIEVGGVQYAAKVPYSCCKNVEDELGSSTYNITQCLMGETRAINTEGCHKAWSTLMRLYSIMTVVLAGIDLAFKIVLFPGGCFLWWKVSSILKGKKADHDHDHNRYRESRDRESRDRESNDDQLDE